MILKESSWGIKIKKSYPKLNQNIETDVVIVGAGLVGILNAYILSKAGLKVVVLEKNKNILQGVTLYTTAFIVKALDSSYTELISLFGPDKAKLVWQSGQEAIDLIKDIIKQENIDCEFKPVSAFLFAQDKKAFENITSEYEALKKDGFEVRLDKNSSKFNFKNSGFMEIPKQAMFQPIKFGLGLAQAAEAAGTRIFTDSEALTLDGLTVKTQNGNVRAKDILIATYYPLTQEGTKFKKAMYVSYVYELQIPLGLIGEGMYFDMNNPYHYFRIDHEVDFDRMIVGGEDHRKDLKINPEKNFHALENYIKSVLGHVDYKLTRKWSGEILEPSDGLALIGQIKRHTLVATAFSGNGMTYSAISSLIVRDLILKNKNPYIHLYDPKRNPSLVQLLKKGSDYIGEFFGGALKNFFR